MSKVDRQNWPTITRNYDDIRPVLFVEPMRSSVDPSYIAGSNLLLFLRRFIDSELNGIETPFSSQVLAVEDPEALSIEVSDFAVSGSIRYN